MCLKSSEIPVLPFIKITKTAMDAIAVLITVAAAAPAAPILGIGPKPTIRNGSIITFIIFAMRVIFKGVFVSPAAAESIRNAEFIKRKGVQGKSQTRYDTAVEEIALSVVTYGIRYGVANTPAKAMKRPVMVENEMI